MLEQYKEYCIKEITDLKDFVTVAYVLIDDIYQKVTPTYIKERRNIKECILSDSEIITIGIVGELITIDSENAWFGFCRKNLGDLFPNFCDRTRFNRTRRNLHSVIEAIRNELSLIMQYNYDTYRIIDSIPIPVCKFGRAHFHRTFKEQARYGRCPAKKETYFGFKLHTLTTLNGFITDFVVTAANVDDRNAVWELFDSYNSITVLGDKGYINSEISPELKTQKNITLIPLKRNKSKNQYSKSFRRLVFKARRMIETTASKLTEQLNIQKVLAKSKLGFITRIATKVLGHNLCYYINKLLGSDVNISKIKHLIFG